MLLFLFNRSFYKYSAIISILCLSAFSCKETQSNENKVDTYKNDPYNTQTQGELITKDTNLFSKFYTRFHKDSIFQINHILWPLPIKDDNSTWQKETWKMHKAFTAFEDFEIERKEIAPDLIIETIQGKKLPLYIERRFSKMEGKWFLIYYRIKQ